MPNINNVATDHVQQHRLKIVVGSQSEVKLNAVKNALRALNVDADVIGVKAKSGINEQPVANETVDGARNRVADARRLYPDADMYIAVENGIFPKAGSWIDKAVILAVTRGGKESLEYSQGVEFPKQYVEEAHAQGFDKITVGQVMQKHGAVAKHDDPHLSLAGKSRATIIEDTLKETLPSALGLHTVDKTSTPSITRPLVRTGILYNPAQEGSREEAIQEGKDSIFRQLNFFNKGIGKKDPYRWRADMSALKITESGNEKKPSIRVEVVAIKSTSNLKGQAAEPIKALAGEALDDAYAKNYKSPPVERSVLDGLKVGEVTGGVQHDGDPKAPSAKTSGVQPHGEQPTPGGKKPTTESRGRIPMRQKPLIPGK